MLSQNRRLLRQTEEKIHELAKEAEGIEKTVEKERRTKTDEETHQMGDLHSKILGLKKDVDALKEQIKLEEDIMDAVRDGKPDEEKAVKGDGEVRVVNEPPISIGKAFTETEEFKRIQNPANRVGSWSSGGVEIDAYQTKGTLLVGTTGSGSGLVPVPQVAGGVVDKLFQRNVFANLLGSGTVGPNANSIRYTVEGTATSAAAGVAEAGTKPESTLGLSTKDQSLKKLATLLPVSEETLEDASQVESYINGRLSLFIQNLEDLQLIRGGGSDDLQGIIGTTGVNIYGGGTAAGNKAVQIFKAVNGVRGSAFTNPEWIVLNPSDYQDLRLLQDANNQFYGGGPWSGQYGVGGQTDPGSLQNTGAQEALWGLRVYVTSNVGAGTALAGNSMDAIVWRKGGIRVDATNSHSTYFANNLVAIRAEERLALAVYRPSSFVEIRLA